MWWRQGLWAAQFCTRRIPKDPSCSDLFFRSVLVCFVVTIPSNPENVISASRPHCQAPAPVSPAALYQLRLPLSFQLVGFLQHQVSSGCWVLGRWQDPPRASRAQAAGHISVCGPSTFSRQKPLCSCLRVQGGSGEDVSNYGQPLLFIRNPSRQTRG